MCVRIICISCIHSVCLPCVYVFSYIKCIYAYTLLDIYAYTHLDIRIYTFSVCVPCVYVVSCIHHDAGWLRWVGSIKLHVSFAKEPYKTDDILQKRPVIFWIDPSDSSHPICIHYHTQYVCTSSHTPCVCDVCFMYTIRVRNTLCVSHISLFMCIHYHTHYVCTWSDSYCIHE